MHDKIDIDKEGGLQAGSAYSGLRSGKLQLEVCSDQTKRHQRKVRWRLRLECMSQPFGAYYDQFDLIPEFSLAVWTHIEHVKQLVGQTVAGILTSFCHPLHSGIFRPRSWHCPVAISQVPQFSMLFA